jgi:hypothetical protein
MAATNAGPSSSQGALGGALVSVDNDPTLYPVVRIEKLGYPKSGPIGNGNGYQPRSRTKPPPKGQPYHGP